ncbi:MAG: GNAT family N-acetyltransferase [Bacteroidales bacterium]|nr:GNAT family N-acetyltransferase [Bacteroidales bacterium]
MAIQLTTYYHSKDIPPLPGENTFHSTELFKIYEATPGYTPLLIVARKAEVVKGKILAATRTQKKIFPPSIIKRCVIYDQGEFFCKSHNEQESLFGFMLEHLTKEALRNAFIIEFRNLSHAKFGYRFFRQNGYFPMNWLRVRNTFSKNKTIESDFSPSRRRQIRKGLKNGATVREAKSYDEINTFAEVLKKNYSSKIRKHFPNQTFFKNMKNVFKENKSRIFIVTYKDKIIGGSACIYSKESAFLWFSGGLRKSYRTLFPGVLAVWIALKDAKQRNYKHLEFMDVGLAFRPHGYRDFVLRFGGKQSSTRRWFRFKWKWLNKAFIKLYI